MVSHEHFIEQPAAVYPPNVELNPKVHVEIAPQNAPVIGAAAVIDERHYPQPILHDTIVVNAAREQPIKMIPNILIDPIYHDTPVVAEPSNYGYEHHYHIAEKGNVVATHITHDLSNHYVTGKPSVTISDAQATYVDTGKAISSQHMIHYPSKVMATEYVYDHRPAIASHVVVPETNIVVEHGH